MEDRWIADFWRASRSSHTFSSRTLYLFDEEMLAGQDERLRILAAVANRTFVTTLAVRTLAEVIHKLDVEDVEEGGDGLSPSRLEAILLAIALLSADLNKEVCQAADLLDFPLAKAD